MKEVEMKKKRISFIIYYNTIKLFCKEYAPGLDVSDEIKCFTINKFDDNTSSNVLISKCKNVMKYSYYFKSDSGDSMHIISENHYETAVDFMKNEFIGEYEAWKDEEYEDDEIPYAEFSCKEIK